jgi:hypothetical protein
MPLVTCHHCHFAFEPREDGRCPQCHGEVREFESDDPQERVRERAKTIPMVIDRKPTDPKS